MTTSKTDEKADSALFSKFLIDHNAGQTDASAASALRRLVAAVEETGKKGTVTLKVSIEPMKNTDGMVLTTIDVAEKLPTLPLKGAVFYTDQDGTLSRRDPRQESLFDGDVREVEESAGPAEVRDLGDGAGVVRDLRAGGAK